MELNNFNNGKSTPSKRTGFHSNISSDSEVNPKPAGNDSPEIHIPKPSNATNDIPIEVPGRGAHGDQ